MVENNKGLSARELLTETFHTLTGKLGGKEIKLFSRAKAEIANDSDWHRTRVGYTGYESAMLLRVGDQEWAVAFGTKCGSYPADSYDCDIAAVQVSGNGKSSEQVAKEIHHALEGNSYFCNSLICAMADGQLIVKENGSFSQKVLELLKPKVKEFIAQDLETNPNLFTMDLRPMVESAVRYKEEFVVFLSEMFQVVLAVPINT